MILIKKYNNLIIIRIFSRLDDWRNSFWI